MADVVIDRCTLRVCRRNGWSWGREPAVLLDAAILALPDLLAKHLAALWPDDADLKIETPLRLRIPISLSELTALHNHGESHSNQTLAASAGTFNRRLDATIEQTLRLAHLLPDDSLNLDDWSFENPAELIGEPRLTPAASLLDLLLKWHAQGLLETLLASFKLSSLTAWHRQLFRSSPPELSPGLSLSAEMESLISELEKKIPRGVSLDRAGILRRRLASAIEIIARQDTRAMTRETEGAVERLWPLIETEADALQPANKKQTATEIDRSIQNPADQIAPIPLAIAPANSKPLSTATRIATREVRIASALPFLLLEPLVRVGYLETLRATLEAAQLTPQAPLFALALAYKVLEPPARGWRRDPACKAAAVAFAGLTETPGESELVDFARQIALHLSPLDSVLSTSLVDGHAPGGPLFLYQTDDHGRLALVDVDGTFPIALAKDLAEMLPVLRRFDGNILLVPKECAQPQLLAALDTNSFPFITDGPPARGEDWRSFQHGRQRWWTNDRRASRSVLLRAADFLAVTAEQTAELWSELDARRPGVPLVAGGDFDRHLTLSASVSLGTIAWRLWRARETTAPQLALSRFRNLEARVQFGAELIKVFLPRGKRFQDLFDHRLLKDVVDVPWLDGRRIQFAGG